MSNISIEVLPRATSNHQGFEVALIADQVPSESIAAVLNREGLNFSPFADVDALLKRSPRHVASLIVLWVDDAASGLAAHIESLMRSLPQTPLVVACSSIERWEIRSALTAGAAGVVLADDLDSTLGPCLRAVQVGQTCVPRKHWRQIEPAALSSREKQILGLVVTGCMNSQIAERLFLAESTVKSHLSSAFGKLGVHSRNEAVDLILDSERGLGIGILATRGEPLESTPVLAQ